MATIQIRNVPDDVHATLVRRAKEAHMSLQEHLLAQLTEQARKPTIQEWVQAIEDDIAANPGRRPTTSAAEIIRADRDERSR
jgi:plasmid stability protein